MCEVNIIMATYQGEKYIVEQLESLLASKYENWKLDIFDDGSFDNTKKIIKEYEKRYPKKIKVYDNKRNLGLVKNFLNGLLSVLNENNSARYYMFSDQDDIWFRDKIDKMLLRMKKIERVYGSDCPILVFSDAVIVDKEQKVLRTSYHNSQKLNVKKIDLAHILMENKCSGCMMMINKALARKLYKMPVHARYHDWWLALIASSFGHISYIKSKTIMYRQHGNNQVGNQSKAEYIKSRLRDLNAQKKTLLASRLQAREFFKIYQHELSEKNHKIIQKFINLHQETFIRKRIDLISYGFLKSTLIRNIGILLLI